jgi:hypothetical protein
MAEKSDNFGTARASGSENNLERLALWRSNISYARGASLGRYGKLYPKAAETLCRDWGGW